THCHGYDRRRGQFRRRIGTGLASCRGPAAVFGEGSRTQSSCVIGKRHRAAHRLSRPSLPQGKIALTHSSRPSKETAMNEQQYKKIQSGQGFIAALDQSGGSTPKALKLYGIQE